MAETATEAKIQYDAAVYPAGIAWTRAMTEQAEMNRLFTEMIETVLSLPEIKESENA